MYVLYLAIAFKIKYMVLCDSEGFYFREKCFVLLDIFMEYNKYFSLCHVNCYMIKQPKCRSSRHFIKLGVSEKTVDIRFRSVWEDWRIILMIV